MLQISLNLDLMKASMTATSSGKREIKRNIQQIGYFYRNQNVDYSFKSKAFDLTIKTYNLITPLAITMKELSPEVLVELAEVCHQEPATINIADDSLKLYLDLNPNLINKNNFFIRGLFVKAQIEGTNVTKKKAEEAIVVLKSSLGYIIKGLEVISKPENKTKYAFLTYNASIIAYNIIRNYLKPNWSKNFFEVFEKLSSMLEEADDIDFNWRLRILMKLAQAYLDADKKAEGGKAIDKIADLLKKKGESEFMEELLRYRIYLARDNNAVLGNLKKEAETNTNPALKFIHTLQCIKCGAIPENNLEKEVQGLITTLTANNSKTPSVKIDTWKADILAELAYILIKKEGKYQPIAINLYETLVTARSNTLKGKIFMENLRAIILLIKLENELKANYKPEHEILKLRIDTRVEALKIIDRNLSGVTRVGDSDLINETCMQVFNLALPFMKKTHRKHYQKAFVSAAELLEGINSNEASLRASIHFELAKCYLDEDLLSEADSHLLKALSQDYSLPLNKLTNYKANEANTNVNYLQRNLEGFLVYAKRCSSVKTNIYGDPDGLVDFIIFETDSIKNSRNEEIKIEKINSIISRLKNFSFEEFKFQSDVNTRDKDLVEEEIANLKVSHDLKVLDDKKHLTLALLEVAKLAFDLTKYQSVLTLFNEVMKWSNIWNPIKDLEQILALAEFNLLCSACCEEFLLEMNLEIGSADLIYFNLELDVNGVPIPNSSPIDENVKALAEQHKINMFNFTREATRLAVSISQHWFVFNIAVRLWNAFLPIIRQPNFTLICHNAVLSPMNDLFEAMNSAMSFYESVNSEISDTDYFSKIDIFVNLSAIYAKLLESKGKPEECVRVCDVMLSRKLNSNRRKLFDTLKARALKSDTGKKTNITNNKAKPGSKTTSVYSPSPEQLSISECFSNLENARISKDDKSKLDSLKKGLDILKLVKINLEDEACLELNAELWYKYGVQFYSLDSYLNYKYALLCAENCVKTFDLEKKPDSLSLMKWYSVGFLLYGDSIYKLVDKDKQERLSQIKLYFTAIDKMIQSAKIAEQCEAPYVILQCFKAFYSVVIQVMDQPQSREGLVKRFLDLHKILLNNKKDAGVLYADSEFLLLFYSIFCLCINETKNWTMGESIISEALKMIPSTLHHFLLEHKLFYYSKLGKNFLQGVTPETSKEETKDANKKDKSKQKKVNSNSTSTNSKDILTKAKLYTKLARSSNDPKAQFDAYSRAIDLLKTDQNILVGDVIFELSTWMYKRGFHSDDVEDNLLQASDILLEIEPVFDDEEDLEESQGSLHSRRSTSSRKSRISKRSRSKLSESKKKANSVSNRGKNSRSGRSRASSDVKTKTIFAKLLECDPYPLFLNISHLESLFKIHVMLTVNSDDPGKKLNYSLDACFFLTKILDVSFKTLNCVEFYEKNKEEITKMSFGDDLNPLNSLISNFFISKDLNIPQLHSLPDNADNWIHFNFPDSLTKKIQEENNPMNPSILPIGTIFCKRSFDKPYQFFYYLNYLIEKVMNEFYFHTIAVMLVKFAVLFAEFILQDETVKYTFLLKLKRLYHVMLGNENFTIIENLNILINQQNLPIMNQEKKWKSREDLRKIDINLNTEEVFEEDNVVLVVDSLKEHVVWILLSAEFYNHGYFNYAKDFLEESIFHCLVLKDKSNIIKANLLLAKIYFNEADFNSSFKIMNKIQSLNCDIEMMFEVAQSILNMFDYLNKHSEALFYSQNLVSYLNSVNKVDKFFKDKILNFVALNETKIKIKKYLQEMSNENKLNCEIIDFCQKEILSYLKKYENNVDSVQTVSQLLSIVEFTLDCVMSKNHNFVYLTSEEMSTITNDIFTRLLIIIGKSDIYLTNLQTYVPAKLETSLYYLPLHRLLGLVKITFAKINNLVGEFKNKIKIIYYNKAESVNDEQMKNLLQSLDYSIVESNNEEEKIYQQSIALLDSSESLLPQGTKEYLSYIVEKINSYRLQAEKNKEMKLLWDEDTLKLVSALDSETNNRVNYNIPVCHQHTLNLISQLEIQINQNLINLTHDSNKDLLKYYFNILESSGYLNIELAFKSLCDYQNATCKLYFSEVVQRYLDPLSKDWVNVTSECQAKLAFNFQIQQINSLSLPESLLNYQKSLMDLPYLKNLAIIPSSWNETKISLVTNPNSAYFVFQMSEDRCTLYLGLMYVINGVFNYELKKLNISQEVNKRLDDVIKTIKGMKNQLIKSVIISSEDLNNIYEEYNSIIGASLNLLQEQMPFSEIINKYDTIINPTITEETPQDNKKNTNVNSKTKATISETVPSTSSGIDSITFLIDYRFIDLPFEFLNVFAKIPYKSHDFSIQTLVNRIRNNSSVSSVQPVKYYFDYSSKMPLKNDLKKVVESRLTTNQGKDKKGEKESTSEGILSMEHFPSTPELQKLISTCGTFFFTSQTSFLYQLAPFEVLDCSKFSKCKSAIILDRISNLKNFVDQKSLVPNKFSFMFQPLDMIALFTLIGCTNVFTTRWSLNYDETSELVEDIFEQTSKGLPLSYALTSYRNPKVQKPKEVERPVSKGIKKGKEKENVNLNDENAVLTYVNKKEVFKFAPILFGLNNHKTN